MEQLKTDVVQPSAKVYFHYGGDGNTFLYGSLTEVPDKLLTNELPGQGGRRVLGGRAPTP